jgi:dienelactone hydrolase
MRERVSSALQGKDEGGGSRSTRIPTQLAPHPDPFPGLPRGAFTSLLAATLLTPLLGAAPASAESLVKFMSAGRGESVQGYLTKPKGAGPFPAVVLLHTCLGLPANRRSVGENFAAWGYVALFVDDFATRSLKETCGADFPQALPDAYGALAYLSALPEVDPARIAAVGFSQGADTALRIASSAPAGGAEPRFKAAAAFYPPCANISGAKLQIPTLIMIGAKDDVTPASDCARLAAAQADGTVKLVVYPGARHGFDLPEFGRGTQVLGMTIAYDRPAAEKSKAELRDFLGSRLGRQ